MFIFKVIFWILALPFKILFFWLPSGSDSYETNDEEYMFWKDQGHNY
ncbi:MAG: hypothetical protein IKF64_05935 [Eubacterium sp.]|nr:hypothetical protein [Eubacterium sp.]